MIYEITESKHTMPIFEGWQETLIWSCLQNVMGHLYGDSPQYPASAMACLENKRRIEIHWSVDVKSYSEIRVKIGVYGF